MWCYSADNGRFFLKGRVGAKWRNAELARFLWGQRADGETWELMYSLLEFESIDTPYDVLNGRWGYKPLTSPRSFRLLGRV